MVISENMHIWASLVTSPHCLCVSLHVCAFLHKFLWFLWMVFFHQDVLLQKYAKQQVYHADLINNTFISILFMCPHGQFRNNDPFFPLTLKVDLFVLSLNPVGFFFLFLFCVVVLWKTHTKTHTERHTALVYESVQVLLWK